MAEESGGYAAPASQDARSDFDRADGLRHAGEIVMEFSMTEIDAQGSEA
jgi:hypothetical protein